MNSSNMRLLAISLVLFQITLVSTYSYAQIGLVKAAGIDSGNISGGGGDISGGGGDISGGGGDFQLASGDVNSNFILFNQYLVGADKLQQQGYNGTGGAVVIVDSGISQHFSGINKVKYFLDLVGDCPAKQFCDGHSHGTIITDIIHQIAPGADLLIVRALDANATGKIANVIKAIRWAKRNKNKFNIRVLNLSLVSEDNISGSWNEGDELRKAIDSAVQAGILVVTASGNLSQKMIYSLPANSQSAITVGSISHRNSADPEQHEISTFSNIGYVDVPETKHTKIPLLYESVSRKMARAIVKPDILAPGEGILAELEVDTLYYQEAKYLQELADAKTRTTAVPIINKLLQFKNHGSLLAQVQYQIDYSYLKTWQEQKEFITHGRTHFLVNNNRTFVQGTSFAAAFVSGGIALLSQAFPKLKSKELQISIIQQTQSPKRALSGEGLQSYHLLYLEQQKTIGTLDLVSAFLALKKTN
jgi:subtilisin family serine protease